MRLGWTDDDYGELRATGDDRRAVLKLIRVAEREGRVDATEYDRRLRAVEAAGTRAQLAALAADLPSRSGERDWDDRARVRRDHRDLGLRVLAEGLTDGRLTAREYEQRAAALLTAATYAQLKALLDGVPGRPARRPGAGRTSGHGPARHHARPADQAAGRPSR